MKLSKYNIELKRNNEYVIINTRTGFKLRSKLSLNEISAKIKRNNDIEKIYIESGIVVADIDEFDLALKELEKKRSSDDVLLLVIYTTDDCNCACVYCPQEKKPSYLLDSDVNKIIKFVSRRIKQVKFLNVEWFGGEPLMNFFAIQKLSRAFMALCAINNVKYSAGVITNGTLLTDRNFIALSKYGVYNYQITIDGLSNVHDVQRPLKSGKSSFDLIIKNLLNIKENHKEKDVRINIRINVTKLIYEQLDDFFDVLYQMFGDDERFRIFIRMAYDWGGSSISKFKQYLIHKNIWEEIYIKAKEKKLRLFEEETYFSPLANVCNAAKKNYYGISLGANVFKCTLFREEKNCIGYINEDGVLIEKDDICNQKWLTLNNRTEKCKECLAAPLCMGLQCPYYNRNGNKYSCNDLYNNISKYLEIIE